MKVLQAARAAGAQAADGVIQLAGGGGIKLANPDVAHIALHHLVIHGGGAVAGVGQVSGMLGGLAVQPGHIDGGAALAAQAGLDGVVCSPLEAGVVHERCGKDFLTVTPGVRFADGDVGDQKRVTTPAKAKELGSDYIVVGRPITQAEDPVAAYRRCVAEFVG